MELDEMDTEQDPQQGVDDAFAKRVRARLAARQQGIKTPEDFASRVQRRLAERQKAAAPIRLNPVVVNRPQAPVVPSAVRVPTMADATENARAKLAAGLAPAEVTALAPQIAPARPKQPGLVDDARILATKTAIGMGEVVTGAADLGMAVAREGFNKAFGTKIDPMLPGEIAKRTVGYDPNAARAVLNEGLSERQKAADKAVADAKGFIPTLKAIATHPSTAINTVLESAPQIAGGGFVAKGLLKLGSKALAKTVGARIAASGVGEGGMQVGSSASQTRQETGGLTGTQAGLVVSSGAFDAVIGALGGKLANRFGFDDIDNLMAGLKRNPQLRQSVAAHAKSVLGGSATETLEETLQTAQERMHQNVQTGRPVMEGVKEETAMGAVAGLLVGSGSNVATGVSAEVSRREARTDEIDEYARRLNIPVLPTSRPVAAAPPPAFVEKVAARAKARGIKLPGDELHGEDVTPQPTEVETALTTLKQEHAAATDDLTKGELSSRINMLEAQGRKLRGEPEPEVATADASRAATAAGVRSLDTNVAPSSDSPAPVTESVAVPSAPAQAGIVGRGLFTPAELDALDQHGIDVSGVTEQYKTEALQQLAFKTRNTTDLASSDYNKKVQAEYDRIAVAQKEPLTRELEELAHYAVGALRAIGDRTDEMVASAAIKRLPDDQKKAVRARIKAIQQERGTQKIDKKQILQRIALDLASESLESDTEAPPSRDEDEVTAPAGVPVPKGGVTVVRRNVADLIPDPERFQYKGETDAEGAGGELKGVKTYDERIAGNIAVWRDPATGVYHPVNGHNRRALAVRVGHPSVNTIEIEAATADDARSQGAIANIAEGRGTAIDAATFFRNSKLEPEALTDVVSVKGSIMKHGMALAKLAPDVFSKVARGEVSEGHGSAIGDMLRDPVQQRAAVAAIEGRRLSDSEVREVARQVRDAGTETVNQDSLFGTEAVGASLYVERAQLANLVKRRLASDKRLFGFVAKSGRKEALARGGNVIDAEQSREIAQESGQLEEVFNQLYTRSGPIADALTQAAKQVANGAAPKALADALYPAIREAIQSAFGGGQGGRTAASGAADPVGQPATGEGDRAADAEAPAEVTPPDPSQNALFEPSADYGPSNKHRTGEILDRWLSREPTTESEVSELLASGHLSNPAGGRGFADDLRVTPRGFRALEVYRDQQGGVQEPSADYGPDLFGETPKERVESLYSELDRVRAQTPSPQTTKAELALVAAINSLEEPDPSADQGGLFGGNEGTTASRSLKEAEVAARAELAQLNAKLDAMQSKRDIYGNKDTHARLNPKDAARKAALERLVNRDKKITADELRTRGIAGEQNQLLENRVLYETSPRYGKASPEKIKTPAVRTPSGEIVEGRFHFDAWERALAKGLIENNGPPGKPSWDIDESEEGFVTTRGRFVNRDEAYEIAERQHQLADTIETNPELHGPPGSLGAEDLKTWDRRVLEPPADYGKDNPQTAAFRRWFGDSKVVDAQGNPLVVYHGMQRSDRFGPRIIKGRATSGPMPFFTVDPEIASSYATGKADNSLPDEDSNYDAWFRVKLPGMRKAVNLDRAWYSFTPEQRAKIRALAPRVTTSDDGEQIILGPESETRGNGGYDINDRDVRGNPIKGLTEAWLNSAALFGEEERFHEVLKLAGVDVPVEMHDPNATFSGVAPVHLSIQNPLVTNTIAPRDVEALQRAANRQRPPRGYNISDPWNKGNRDPQHWMEELRNDLQAGKNSFVWSSIPDWVTKTLKGLGYDGIHDTGGKMGGVEHDVWVPFEPGQIKSAIANRGTYDRSSANILKEPGASYGHNPFRAKAIAARERADRLNRPTAHDAGMANAFPLGAGFGRPGGAKRIERSVSRAVEAVKARKDAEYLEAQADAFDKGKITAQGRRRSPEFDKRTEKAGEYRETKAERIAAARAIRGDKSAWKVTGDVYATGAGYLGGPGRRLILADHREAVERALAKGETIPPEVLADYPDLVKPDGDQFRLLEPGAKYGNAAPQEDAPAFYSRLSRAIEAGPHKGTAEQWSAALSKNVAKAEREWTGIDTFLAENKGKVLTKQEVQDAFEKGAIQVETTTLRQVDPVRVKELDGQWEHLHNMLVNADMLARITLRGTGNLGFDTPTQALHAIGDHADWRERWEVSDEEAVPLEKYVQALRAQRALERSRDQLTLAGRPKFASYTEPGGENYREVLISLKRPATLPDGYRVVPNPYQVGTMKWIVEGPAFAGGATNRYGSGTTPEEAIASFRQHHDKTGTFTSSHWDQPNVLVHIRLSGRKLASGVKALHVEEVQSDWHQKGRKSGYQNNDAVELARLGAELEQLRNARPLPTTPGTRAFRDQSTDAENALIDRMNAIHDRGNYGVPDAPFKKTDEWAMLAMKHVIDEAVKGGYSRVIWTPGGKQADRYDLSKQVDEVRYDAASGSLQALKDDRTVHTGIYDAKALSDVIGKDAADKLLASESKRWHRDDVEPYHRIEGEDLKVGGMGMRKFYDEMLPKALKDYGKKIGAPITIEQAPLARGYEIVHKDNGSVRGRYNSQHDANLAMEQMGRESRYYDVRQAGAQGSPSVQDVRNAAELQGEGPDGAPGPIAEVLNDVAEEMQRSGDSFEGVLAYLVEMAERNGTGWEPGVYTDARNIMMDDQPPRRVLTADDVRNVGGASYARAIARVMEDQAPEDGDETWQYALDIVRRSHKLSETAYNENRAALTAAEEQAEPAVFPGFAITPELTAVVKGEGQYLMEKGAKYASPSEGQIDLFATARQNPTSAAAMRSKADEAKAAFGSLAKQRKALAKHAAAFAAMERSKVTTVAERVRQVAAHEAQELINLRGVRLRTETDAARAMDTQRSPTIERINVMHLADATDDLSGDVSGRFGDVMLHTADTVGALTFANVPDTWLDQVVEDAKRAGTTRVLLGHNHPSGDAESSKYADNPWTIHATEYLAARGITVVGHLVIDHNEYAWINPDGSGKDHIPFKARPAKYKTAIEAGRESFSGSNAQDRLASYLATVAGPEGVTLAVIDASHRIVAMALKTPDDLRIIKDWLPGLLERTGGKSIIVAADYTTAGAFAQQINDVLPSPQYWRGMQGTAHATWADDILDVFAVFKPEHGGTVSLGKTGAYHGDVRQYRFADIPKVSAAAQRVIGEPGPRGRLEDRRGATATLRESTGASEGRVAEPPAPYNPPPPNVAAVRDRLAGDIDIDGSLAKEAAKRGPRSLSTRLDKIADAVKNSLGPIERLGTLADNRPSRNPYDALVYAESSDTTVDRALHEGVLDPITRDVVGPSFDAIFAPIKDSPQLLIDAFVYLKAKRDVGRGISSVRGNNQLWQDALDFVAYGDAHPELSAFATRWEAFTDAIGNYAVGSGLWTPQLWAKMKASDVLYVRYKRIMEDAVAQRGTGGGRTKTMGNVGPGVDSFIGSERAIENPARAMVEYTAQIIRRADRYRVGHTIMDAIDDLGPAGELIGRRISAPTAVHKAISAQLGHQTPLAPTAVLDEIRDLFDPKLDAKNPVLWRNGPNGKEYMQIDADELWTSIMQLNIDDLVGLRAVLDVTIRPLKRVFTASTTGWSPRFSLATNPTRDIPTAHAQSQAGITSADIAKGFAESAKEVAHNLLRTPKSDLADEAARFGLAGMSFFDQDKPKFAARRAAPISRKERVLNRIGSATGAPVAVLEAAGRASDLGPRLGEYAAAKRMNQPKVASGQWTEPELKQRAARLAKVITLNFNKRPGNAVLHLIADYIPFFGVSTHAPFVAAEAGRRNPKRFGTVYGIAAMAAVAAWVLKHAALDDDELAAFNDRPSTERAGFLYLPTKYATFRIPLGQEMGIVVNGVTAGLDKFFDDDPAAGALLASTLARALPAGLDAIAKGVVPFPGWQQIQENNANKKVFGGRPVEPRRLQDLPPSERRLDTTAPTFDLMAAGMRTFGAPSLEVAARGADASPSLPPGTGTALRGVAAVGRGVGFDQMSPLKAENLTRGLFSSATPLVTGLTDPIAKRLTGRSAKDRVPRSGLYNPLNPASAFVAAPASSTESEDDFYAIKTRRSQGLEQKQAAVTARDSTSYRATRTEYGDLFTPAVGALIDRADERIKTVRDREGEVRTAYQSGRMTGEEARTKLDRLALVRQGAVRKAMKALRAQGVSP